MSQKDNSIIIDSGKVIIIEHKKPLRVLFYFAIFLFGAQGIAMILEYQETQQLYHLVSGAILAFLVGLFVSREFFFKTFRNEIAVDEISRVTIQKVLFGNGNVYLNLKLKRKTREVFIDKHRALEVKKEIDSLG